MGVFKDRNTWRVVVYVEGRIVARKRGFPRQRDAAAWHDEARTMHLKGDPRLADKPKTFEELLDRFERFHLPTIAHTSKLRYMVEIDQRIRPYFRFMRLDRIGPEMLETFKAHLGNTMAHGSANYCLDTLRLVLNKAVKWKMLRESPWSLDHFSEPAQAFTWWDDRDEISRFLATARERSSYFPVYLTALETGMRFAELVGLWKTDIDLAQGRIHVQRQWIREEKDYRLPKHGKSRYIDFDPSGELGRVLTDAVARSSHPTLVFPSRGGRHLAYSKLAQKSFKSMIERAKVRQITFHDMRHTFASHYMLAHDNVFALQGLLGHADIQVTMRYAHHSKRSRRAPLGLSELLLTAPKSLPVSKLALVSGLKH